ncbi:MAG: peptidoglycan DD-metalloendopeptidase family protein [Acidobacteria bacterium]|nr:peptidoglycan DD-metalloendopeptidase family protein [Acidobacteriota bacterium]
MSDVTASQGIGRGGAPVAGDTDRVRIRALAQQFESMLLAQMLEGMKQAMTPDAESQGLGGQIMGDTISAELALALGRAGGLGLSELVGTALARLDAVGGGRRAPEVPSGDPLPDHIAPPVAPSLASAATALPAPEGRPSTVTSDFGWRVDPLNGRHRFHAGQDLRAAYGEEVRSATEGTVTFAGEKSGYGLVLVVSHGSGLETRYAHLSSVNVPEGARVRAGDLIARSGSSGRVTAPHLHFEVRQHGQPVDPGTVAGLVPAVGSPPGGAD